ncbi:MAG: hypothetical protein M0Z46_15135 [Actinomycetota bacterium]|nr:hypothetical protein [Actinomycetota bacterium]
MTNWQQLYPAAAECLTTDVWQLTTYLRFPREYWARIRQSSFVFVKRTLRETCCRVKLIGWLVARLRMLAAPQRRSLSIVGFGSPRRPGHCELSGGDTTGMPEPNTKDACELDR